jgi:ribose transport system substrate-binding protein
MTRKRSTKVAVLACLVAVLLSMTITGYAAEKLLLITYVPKDTNSPYWLVVKAGADAAAKKYGARVQMLGPSVPTDIASQVSIVNDQITRRVDAILLTAGDKKALVPAAERARREGVPFITVDSGVDSDAPLSYIATDNVSASKVAAEVLAKLMGNKGKALLMSFVAGSQTAAEREQGFKQGISQFRDVQLIGTQYSLADATRAMSIMDNVLTATPDLAGVFTSEEKTGAGVARQLEISGKAKDIKFVAFDASDALIQALQKGIVDALVVQQPYQMGYLGVEFAVKAIRGESIPAFVETPTVVVTRDNFNDPDIQKILYP